MVKTMRSRKMGTTRRHHHTCKYNATMHGLHKWHTKLFEELGWMVLANERGMVDKINNYKDSLYRLKEHLECKLHSLHEHDRKEDIKILWRNVNVLISHVNKDF